MDRRPYSIITQTQRFGFAANPIPRIQTKVLLRRISTCCCQTWSKCVLLSEQPVLISFFHQVPHQVRATFSDQVLAHGLLGSVVPLLSSSSTFNSCSWDLTEWKEWKIDGNAYSSSFQHRSPSKIPNNTCYDPVHGLFIPPKNVLFDRGKTFHVPGLQLLQVVRGTLLCSLSEGHWSEWGWPIGLAQARSVACRGRAWRKSPLGSG